MALRPRLLKSPRARHDRAPANPLYGYGYRPDFPSITSVAHDPENGGRLLVYTDRPCILLGLASGLPLSVAGLAIVSAEQLLAFKFRLQMNGPVPQGADWAWGLGGGGVILDPITNNPLNAASGSCADTPGPYVPPPPGPALVISSYQDGYTCTLTFDQPAVLLANTPDDAIVFDGQPANGVSSLSAETLQFSLNSVIAPGSQWSINRQPDWLATVVGVPQWGNF